MDAGRVSEDRIAALMGRLGAKAPGGPAGPMPEEGGEGGGDDYDVALDAIDRLLEQAPPGKAEKLQQAAALLEECAGGEGGEELPDEEEMGAGDGAAPPADFMNEPK